MSEERDKEEIRRDQRRAIVSDGVPGGASVFCGQRLSTIKKTLWLIGMIVSVFIVIMNWNYIYHTVIINEYFLVPAKITLGLAVILAFLPSIYEYLGYGVFPKTDNIFLTNSVSLQNVFKCLYVIINVLFMPIGGYTFVMIIVVIHVNLIKIFVR